MLQINHQELLFITTTHIIALSVIMMSFMYIYVKAKRNDISIAFMNNQMVLALWILAKILKTFSPTIELRWAFVVAEYVCTSFLGVSIFQLAYIYVYRKSCSKIMKLVLYLIPLIQSMIVVTNPIHKKVYPDFEKSEFIFGILFDIHIAVVYVLLFISTGLIIYGFIKNYHKYNKVKTILFIITILFPWLINVFFVQGLLDGFFSIMGIEVLFDITPLCASSSVFIFAYMIYKHDFIDIIPIMKGNILQIIDKGIIIMDFQGRIVDYNETAKEIFQIKSIFNDISNHLFSVTNVKEFNRVIGKLHLEKPIFEERINNKYYEVRVKDLGKFGKVLICTDIDDFVKLRLEQIKKNRIIEQANSELSERIYLAKKVAKLNVRNNLSRELHDVLGHSITVAIKLLEVIQIQCRADSEAIYTRKEFIEEKINQAIHVTNASYKEIIKSLLKDDMDENEEEYDTIGLKKEIERLIAVISKAGINVSFEFMEGSQPISANCYKTIVRVVQEGITNAIKHGKASDVKISVTKKLGGCHINILDNGIGCDNVVLGNGLLGMKQRVEKHKGTFSYNSSSATGFALSIEL